MELEHPKQAPTDAAIAAPMVIFTDSYLNELLEILPFVPAGTAVPSAT